MTYTFTTDKTETLFGWYRRVKVGETEYAISVKRHKSVRIPYKRRGQNRGWTWFGTVYKIGGNGGQVFGGLVDGSIGCKGMLVKAGVLTEGN